MFAAVSGWENGGSIMDTQDGPNESGLGTTIIYRVRVERGNVGADMLS